MRLLLRVFLLSVTLFLITTNVPAQSEDGEPGVLRNPINAYGGSDPWLQYYDGNYYLATTTWRSSLTMRKSPTLAGLKTAVPVEIYFETEPSRCCNMWAPEFYLIDGPNGPRWYYYYSAGTADTLDNQRTHVLESESTDPMGPYHYKGRLFDPHNDVWAIDGSVLILDDQLYFLYSSWVGPLQSMFIAEMSDPWTLVGPRHVISRPELAWERQGGNVNEGPVALYHEDQTHIIYSASACSGPDYKLGMLTYNGGDPLTIDSWDKHPEPVFERSDENEVFGPAHNGFFKSPDGTEDWIVYHANDSVLGGCDLNRTTRVQKFTWNDDGTPNFGIPIATTEVIDAPSGDMGIDPIPNFATRETSRFQSFAAERAFIRHTAEFVGIDFVDESSPDIEFIVTAGLADPDGISIEALNLPGMFLVTENNLVLLKSFDNSDDFNAIATWMVRPGLADSDAISLESYAQPGFFIGRRFGVTALIDVTNSTSDRDREEATFIEIRQ